MRFNPHRYFEVHIKSWEIALQNMKRGKLKVKQISKQEESAFHEEDPRLFLLMPIKSYLLFHQHLICIKSTFVILDTQQKQRQNEHMHSPANQKKKISKLLCFSQKWMDERLVQKIFFFKTSEKTFFNNSICTHGTS